MADIQVVEAFDEVVKRHPAKQQCQTALVVAYVLNAVGFCDQSARKAVQEKQSYLIRRSC